jgi:hypothetical protein
MHPISLLKSKILSIFILLAMGFAGFAQAPNLLNYQGVARNAVGNPLPNQSMILRLSVRNLSATGTVVYSETRPITTNLGGLFSVQIGSVGSTSSIGTIAGVNWLVGDKYLQVEIDPAANNNYINLGTVQLVSVPYAFATGNAGTVTTNANLTGVVTSVGNQTSIANGAITNDMIASVNKSKVGLDLVNNTSDASKPISSLTEAALDLKANASELTNLANAMGTKLNIADSTIGYITPSQLAAKTFDQTPIRNAIDTKLNISDSTNGYVTPAQLASYHFSGGGVSTDTTNLSNRINLKASKESPSFTGVPSAPTATAGVSTTQLATTAFVSNAVSNINTSSITGTITIVNGGTGGTTQQAAINALTGTQVSGKFLRSDGTNATLSNIQVADVPTLNQNTTGNAATVTTNANLTGDVTSVGNTSTVVKINGTFLADLGTGILKNTNTTGIPTIAVAGTDYQSPIILTTTGTGAATFSGTTLNIPAVSSTVNASTITGTIAIANGGTGATTVIEALSNLGAAPLASPSFTGIVTSPIFASTPQTLTPGSTISFNPSLGLNARVTLDQNSTLSFSATPAPGSYGTLVITQDVTGSRTLTLPSTANIVLGSTSTTTVALSTTANAKDILNFYYDGTNCYWNIGQGYGASQIPVSAATLLTTARTIHGGSFDGSANVTNIIASTYGGTGNAYTKFLGPSTTEKTFTLPDANATILTNNATVTVAQGGTGASTLTGLVKGNGTSALTVAVSGTDYQAPLILTTTGTGAATLSGTTINIPTPASGSSNTHTIGETYGGGIVVFIWDGGAHGLIAAISDLGKAKWNDNSVTMARADGIGAGLKNTTLIISNVGYNAGASYAAKLCNEYSVDVAVGGKTITYGDWYLPSKFELSQFIANKSYFTGLPTGTYYYWTSNEWTNASYPDRAMYVRNDGYIDQSQKNDPNYAYVRPFRIF